MSPAQSGSEDPYLDDLKRILEFHKKSTAQLGKRTRSGDRAPEPDALGGKLIAQIKEYEELTSKPPGHTDKQRREVPSILRNSFPTKRGPRVGADFQAVVPPLPIKTSAQLPAQHVEQPE